MHDIAVVARHAQHAVAISTEVTMPDFAPAISAHDRILGWLAERGMSPAGAPFFHYAVVDMPRLVVVAGWPVDRDVVGDDDVQPLTLPAGRFATLRHRGHPDELEAATGELLAWADERGLAFDRAESARGEEWACRLEIYETDPAEEPDLSRWETTLVFKLRD
ncbi:GyrI-like small molecule binding protein [Diaminobutyricimonas aerilata]|uniref:GyrI-like small molecule binding protein n=1 Tax=Diaminobutyricimonas aerilata TaxID=1162967 RepID=A0A2M9CKY7_9MICO|nr:GyrI-like domain-containing protein [Diaminobutyricimonas aerilata]PJJ72556.1 GyrI-like small molecule binding protein [Diaminobutyricimonas aerilata]